MAFVVFFSSCCCLFVRFHDLVLPVSFGSHLNGFTIYPNFLLLTLTLMFTFFFVSVFSPAFIPPRTPQFHRSISELPNLQTPINN
jgi:hypothetical protein